MATVKLTAQRLREVLKYDAHTGLLTWIVSRGNVAKGRTAGSTMKSGHMKVQVDGRLFLAHILIWFYVTGNWPQSDIDHKNGVGSDNRWRNLRLASRQINNQNLQRARVGNKSGFLGVIPVREKFQARIVVNGKLKHLGTFQTAEMAGQAYLAAKRLIHIGCTI